MALYDADHGYYRFPRPIGRGGDFYTAVSVGPLYGQLLASVAVEVWRSVGEPAAFSIIEQGAHDGQLAADIWTALQRGPLAAAARYCIVEPREVYRNAQRAKLSALMGDRLHFAKVFSAKEAPIEYGFLVANELLDAFPCSRVRWDGQAWHEMYVREDATRRAPLEWVAGPVGQGMPQDEVAKLPTDLPAGYTTEMHLIANIFTEKLLSHPFKGAALFADYGYEAGEYYSHERSAGTLRRYFEHKMDDCVLEGLGQCDLTAHVNFTRVIEIAEAAGFGVRQFMEQGRFLTHAAKDWLTSLDGQPPTVESAALLRQFQSLTHPSHMGNSFRMLLLERGARVL